MSLVVIEAELARLDATDLRRLAISSWAAFLEKEGADPRFNECNEEDPVLLAALDDAVRRADNATVSPRDGDSVRARVRAWTTG